MRPVIITYLSLLIPFIASAQSNLPFNLKLRPTIDTIISDSLTGDVTIIVRGICKSYNSWSFRNTKSVDVVFIPSPVISVAGSSEALIKRKVNFLSLKGFISYEFYYNQRIDTPFSTRGYKQHSEIVNLQVTVKEKYPFNIIINSRQSNNSLFRNYYQPSIQFDKSSYIELKKNDYLKRWNNKSSIYSQVNQVQNLLKESDLDVRKLSADLSSPEWSQQIIKEREDFLKRKYSKNETSSTQVTSTPRHSIKDFQEMLQLANFALDSLEVKNQNPTKAVSSWLDTLNFDSIVGIPVTPSEKQLETKKIALLSQEKNRIVLQQYCDSLKASALIEEKSLSDSYGNTRRWKKHVKQFGTVENQNERVLMNLKNLGIGRNNISYSELTIKNLSLTGLQIEYEPGLYYAVAGGRIDYRFRDFFYNSNKLTHQEYYIARFGNSYEAEKGVIGSIFYGKKALFNNTAAGFSGYSLESFYNWDRNNFIRVEVAKTTSSSITGQSKQSGLFDIGASDNLGVVAKGRFKFNKTGSILQGYYRSVGHSFQSINFYSNNLDQKAWSIKADQNLWKSSIRLSAMLRRNDFSNPLFIQNFNTSTVFKTFFVSFRKRNYPFFNVGYYPGTQLVKTDSGITENVYYLVNTTLGYSKSLKGFNSNTILNYNSFFNQSTDSGFIYYKGYSFLFNQSFSREKVAANFSFGFTKQKIINYYTIESGVDLSTTSWVSGGLGLKMNKVLNGALHWGGRGHITLTIPKLGVLQGEYDKMFIPNTNNKLEGADLGRLTWTKYF